VVDIHAHLLNSDVQFDRFYDKIIIKNPHDRYIEVMLEYFLQDNSIFTNYKKIIS
jgi:hypothetical protein